MPYTMFDELASTQNVGFVFDELIVPYVDPIAPPFITTERSCGYGWRFELLQPGLAAVPLYPKLDVNIDLDVTRSVTRSISGIVLVPEERRKCDFSRDSVRVYLTIDGASYPMGQYRFTESSSQKGVVKTRSSDNAQDIVHVSLNDRAIELKRNTGEGQTLITGTDPTQIMIAICEAAGVPAAIASSMGSIANDVTWDGGTEELDKLNQLAEFAGHRPPWTDNNGVLRSISASQDWPISYPLSQFKPEAESIVITDAYLSAPNRVIVTDNSFGDYVIRGQWDAPGSAPNSAGAVGFIRTMMVDQSGLGTAEAAQAVARQIGEQLIARKLSAEIVPTNLLDGPVSISYDGALWRLDSWSVSTGSGEMMSISATEIIKEGEAQ